MSNIEIIVAVGFPFFLLACVAYVGACIENVGRNAGSAIADAIRAHSVMVREECRRSSTRLPAPPRVPVFGDAQLDAHEKAHASERVATELRVDVAPAAPRSPRKLRNDGRDDPDRK